MDLGINGKVALVTAASRGLGKATALRLCAEGAKVVICSRTRDAIEAAGDDIARRTGGEIRAEVCDVTDTPQVERLVEAVSGELGSIDILVCNAGGPPAGMAVDFAPDDYRAAVELNLMSTIGLVSAALPQMRRQRWGRIIAVTSIAARQPIANLILSNTARAGVLGFIKTLSSQVAADGITANSVCPGYTSTERVGELAEAFVAAGKGSQDDFYAGIEREVPARRLATPEEFASAVAFLASENAAYITGIALPIDGGYGRALF
jgi:3-oxoacyl-[acyl-carrier protein] reductase